MNERAHGTHGGTARVRSYGPGNQVQSIGNVKNHFFRLTVLPLTRLSLSLSFSLSLSPRAALLTNFLSRSHVTAHSLDQIAGIRRAHRPASID